LKQGLAESEVTVPPTERQSVVFCMLAALLGITGPFMDAISG